MSELVAETICDIIQYDLEANISNNRGTSDQVFTIEGVKPETFDDFVNKFLSKNNFDYRIVKVEYDDELKLIFYSFPSFLHFLAAPLLLRLFNKNYVKGEKEENRVITYFQVNKLLPIVMKSKSKYESFNKNLLIIPDGVILHPDHNDVPILGVEICNIVNLKKLNYKLMNSYTRFKRKESYKTLIVLLVDETFNTLVQVWKKVPIPEDIENYDVKKIVKDYVNIPNNFDEEKELKKIAEAIHGTKYQKLDRSKHKFTYYLQNKEYTINYDSCTFQTKNDEQSGICLSYADVHPNSRDNSIISLGYDEVRNMAGGLIRSKMDNLKDELDCLPILENFRNRAKKNYFDLCEHLDFPGT